MRRQLLLSLALLPLLAPLPLHKNTPLLATSWAGFVYLRRNSELTPDEFMRCVGSAGSCAGGQHWCTLAHFACRFGEVLLVQLSSWVLPVYRG